MNVGAGVSVGLEPFDSLVVIGSGVPLGVEVWMLVGEGGGATVPGTAAAGDDSSIGCVGVEDNGRFADCSIEGSGAISAPVEVMAPPPLSTDVRQPASNSPARITTRPIALTKRPALPNWRVKLEASALFGDGYSLVRQLFGLRD